MRKIVSLILLAALAVACSSASADPYASGFESMMNGTWICVNSEENDVISFVYPASGAVLTAGGTGEIYLTVLNEQTGDYVAGIVTLNKEGTTLVVLPLGQSSPIVYQKSAQSASDPSSPVGEWVVKEGNFTANFTFNADGTCLISSQGQEIEVLWEMGDGAIIMRTDMEGFEDCVCPFDGNSIDCTEMGLQAFAYRQ